MQNEKRQRRRLYRVFLYPRFQLKYGMYYAAIAFTSILILNVVTVYFLVYLIDYSGHEEPGIGITNILLNSIKQNAGIAGLAAFSLFVLYFSLAFIFTKNIAGPLKVLVRHVEELKNGNYGHKTRLRKTDELKPMMSALNELSEVLAAKHGSTRASNGAGPEGADSDSLVGTGTERHTG
jgi:HAMP domain-containing protein